LRHPARQPADGTAVHRRRTGAAVHESAQLHLHGVPGPAAVLPAGFGRVHPLPPAPRAGGGLRTTAMDASLFSSMLFATVVAGTPLIIVALGLLVSERAGVLNLGAEGMMAMGAVAAFAVTHGSGNPWLGVLAGMVTGAAMALLFGFLALTLQANQVASGLALAIFGVGLSAFIGRPFESVALPAVPPIRIPFIADIP